MKYMHECIGRVSSIGLFSEVLQSVLNVRAQGVYICQWVAGGAFPLVARTACRSEMASVFLLE